MNFCLLDDDQKNFAYITKYTKCFNDEQEFLKVDNEIQYLEIQHHLYLNGYTSNNTNEKLRWIQMYGKSFRAYLNTLKLLCIAYLALGKNINEFTFKDYQEIKNNINTIYSKLENCIY